MRLIKLLIMLVLIIMGAAFAVHNSENVTLNYYFGSKELPLSLLLIGTLIIGAVLGIFSAVGSILRLKRENTVLRHKSKVVAEEVENLRAIPLKKL